MRKITRSFNKSYYVYKIPTLNEQLNLPMGLTPAPSCLCGHPCKSDWLASIASLSANTIGNLGFSEDGRCLFVSMET